MRRGKGGKRKGFGSLEDEEDKEDDEDGIKMN